PPPFSCFRAHVRIQRRGAAHRPGKKPTPLATRLRYSGGSCVMVIRRLLGGLFALSVLVFLAAPIAGQDDKDKKKDPQPGSEKAKLEWKFKKGQVFYQKMTTETNQTMNVMNNDVKQTQTQTFFFKWTVLDDPKDNKVKIEQEIVGVYMDIDIGNQKISYKS